MRTLRILLWSALVPACAAPVADVGDDGGMVDTTGLHITERARAFLQSGGADSAVVLLEALLAAPAHEAAPKARVMAHNMLGVHAQRQGRFDEGIAHQRNALGICRDMGDRECEGRAHTNLCIILRMTGDHEAALRHSFDALRIKHEQADSAGLARAHHNLAMVYQEQGDLVAAENALATSLAIKERMGDSLGIQNTLSVMSLVAVDRGEYVASIGMLERARGIAQRNFPDENIVDIHTNLGLAQEGAGRREEAMRMFHQALEELEKFPNDAHRAIVVGNIGRMLLEDGRPAEAGPWLEESLALAREVGSLLDEKIGLTTLLAQRKVMGRHREALELSEALRIVSDSLLNERNVESMNELRVRFETERHEAENRLLQQENELATARLQRQRTVIAALVGGLLLIALVVLLAVRAWRRRTAQRMVELEHQALRAQMDPHFLFNALNTVPGLYHTHGVAPATDYVGHLGQLLRMILDSSAKRLVSVREEVDLLTHYLQVMAFRHPGQFTFSIEVDPAIDSEGTGLPPMLLQPLVENAVLHGVLKREGGGALRVLFQLADERLRCVVQDNGPGLDRSPDLTSSGKPSGLRITHERIRLAQGRRKRGQGLVLRTLKDEQGMAVGTEAAFHLQAIDLWDR